MDDLLNKNGAVDPEKVEATKKKMTTEEKLEALNKRIAKVQEKEDRIRQKRAALEERRKRLAKAEQLKERKARDHRLIQHGAMLEAALCQLFPERYQKETMAAYNTDPDLTERFEKDLYILLERSMVISDMLADKYAAFNYWTCDAENLRDKLAASHNLPRVMTQKEKTLAEQKQDQTEQD